MSSIYGRLGFNTSDPISEAAVSEYTSNTVAQMNMMPPLLKTWQIQDVANSDSSGYYVNPVANVANSIWLSSNSTFSLTVNLESTISSTVNTVILSINAQSNVISRITANNYLYVTNRQSNITPPNDDITTPHYTTAIARSKVLSYLTYQSDNVQNNSPIIGNFTSIMLANTLNPLYSTLSNLVIILANSITPVYNISSLSYANTSNITLANAQSLSNVLSSIQNTMYQYPLQDTTFFNNSQNVINDFTSAAQFSHLGQTELYLIDNFIGTPKLTSRLASN